MTSPGDTRDTGPSELSLAATAPGGHASSQHDLPTGGVLGRYLVLRPLGHGAMGTVYEAYDPKLDRKVALKLLHRSTADLARVQSRVLQEAKAMARLAHPNVVAVYDVGVHDDQLFIAMELVAGRTLRAWLEAGTRPWREIVRMFVAAGRGLAAAHAAGIVHRDFKPDNVLVGDDGRLRVVDFGLARPEETDAPPPASAADSVSHLAAPPGALHGATAGSTAGAIVGTPRYMSLEQLTGDAVNAAADQFAFCASLWEGLYGQPPFDAEDLLDLVASVREGRIRPPPQRDVPGRIRVILERGLSPDAANRYPAMPALLDALEADPERVRNRRLTVAGVILAGGLAVVAARQVGAHRAPLCPGASPRLAAIWDDARRSTVRASFLGTGKPYAEDAFRGASRSLDAYASAWVAMHDDACAATLVRGQQSSELMDLRMTCLDDRLAGLQALTGRFAHADADVVDGALKAADTLPRLTDCANAEALRSPVRAPADPAIVARVTAVRTELASARATRQTSKPVEVVERARRAVDEARQTTYGPVMAEALEDEGFAQWLARDLKAAAKAFREAELAAVVAHDTSLETVAWIDLTRALAFDLQSAEGRTTAMQAHACLDRDGGDDERLATLLLAESRLSYNEGLWDRAQDDATRALEIRRRILPEDHPDIAACLDELGVVVLRKGLVEEAIDFHRRAIAIKERAFGREHPEVAGSMSNLANDLQVKGQYDEGIALQKQILQLLSGAFGEKSVRVADMLNNIGLSYSEADDPRRGLENLQRALDMRLELLGPEHPDVAISYGNLAVPLLSLERWDEAIAAASRRLELQERANGPEYAPLARPLLQIGLGLIGKKRYPDALPPLERALRLAETGRVGPYMLASVRRALALALQGSRADMKRARALAAQARAEFLAEDARGMVEVIDREFPAP